MSGSKKVVQFADKAPHLAGPARCCAPECRHEFVAVAPEGTVAIDCPKCGAAKAARFAFIAPKKGDEVWTCPCGCDVMMLLRSGYLLCPNCGRRQDVVVKFV